MDSMQKKKSKTKNYVKKGEPLTHIGYYLSFLYVFCSKRGRMLLLSTFAVVFELHIRRKIAYYACVIWIQAICATVKKLHWPKDETSLNFIWDFS